jgi:NAD(P)H-dependent flavin oxidoreductase YrpB (nitropropane dioxygenase family)
MPLQGILYAPAAHRFSRARSKALGGSPVGQIVGLMNSVRPAKDVVYDIVEEWIETNERIARGVHGS